MLIIPIKKNVPAIIVAIIWKNLFFEIENEVEIEVEVGTEIEY